MNAKRNIDFIISDIIKGEISVIIHSNKNKNTENIVDENQFKNNLFQVNLESNLGKFEITDKGTEYYKNLKDFFG